MAQARVVDENLSANLFTVSLILKNIRQEIDHAAKLPKNQLDRYLKMQSDVIPGIRTLMITDNQGHCIHSNRDELIGRDLMLLRHIVFLTS